VGEHGLFTVGNLLKPYAALLCAALLTTTLTTTEAYAADPAPTNVQISWKDNTFQQVRVSWDETEALPNVITLRTPGLRHDVGRRSVHGPMEAGAVH
jgi:hypothetical protein